MKEKRPMQEITAKVGEKYPVTESFEGATLTLTPKGMTLLCVLPALTEAGHKGFKSLKAYGIYGGAYPLVIWQFENDWLLETPFNPALEREIRPEAMDLFLTEKGNVMERILLDECSVVQTIVRAGLQWDFIEALKKVWSDPEMDWDGYASWLADTHSEFGTEQLWEKAAKYTHKTQ